MGRIALLDNDWQKRYAEMLQADLKEGLEGDEDLAGAMRFTRGRQKRTGKPNNLAGNIVVIPADQNDHILLARLDTIFYRTLYGREREEDSHQDFPTQLLVAQKNKTPVGAIWYAIEPNPSYEGFLYLDRMVVAERYRGQNIGTKMLVNLLEYVPEGRSIILHAWDQAIPFYVKNGFLSTGEDVEGQGGCFFRKMVLPLDQDTFEQYQQEGWQEELQTAARNSSLYQRILRSIKREYDSENLKSNPFTAVLYRNAGIEHTLLK